VVIDAIQIAKIERELKLLRNRIANLESQNHILSGYVIQVQQQRARCARRKSAARQRKYYLNSGAEKRRQRHQRQIALVIAQTLSFRLAPQQEFACIVAPKNLG
jgi:hypothetical protein